MAFKMKSIAQLLGFNAKYSKQKSFVFESKLPKKVRGMIDMNGRIDVNKNLSEKQKAETVAHERLHLQQMRDGVLKFDRNNYYYKPKVNGFTLIIPTKLVDTRRRDLPWEESVIQKIKKLKKK
jgi:hypothetical protein